MHETGHSKPVLWNNPEGWDGKGGGRGFRMGNTCTLTDDSCQRMAKPVQYCKVISFKKKKKILEWVTIPFSRRSSRARVGTQVSCIAAGGLYCLSHQGSPAYCSAENKGVIGCAPWSWCCTFSGRVAWDIYLYFLCPPCYTFHKNLTY